MLPSSLSSLSKCPTADCSAPPKTTADEGEESSSTTTIQILPKNDAKSLKQQKLDAVQKAMNEKEKELADCKGQIMQLQNLVASLETGLLSDIQEKAELVAADDDDENAENREPSQAPIPPRAPDWQARLKDLSEHITANEETRRTSKIALKEFQDRAASLESEIIADIQEKARINMELDSGSSKPPKAERVSSTPESAIKRQKLV